jgi:single-strand DNA-binding protein
MAGDINNVVLFGRVTRDSELRYSASGMAIANFAIAVNRRVKKGDQWADEASFFDLALFDKQAEGLNQYLVKGTQVGVQGELRQERWEKDGQKHSKVQVHVNNLQLVGGGKREGSAPASESSGAQASPEEYKDDIPF